MKNNKKLRFLLNLRFLYWEHVGKKILEKSFINQKHFRAVEEYKNNIFLRV